MHQFLSRKEFILGACSRLLLSMDLRSSRQRTSLVLAALIAFLSGIGSAETTRTQVFQLDAGWNAIFLDVDPLVNTPEVVFTNTPVDIVACYEGTTLTKQFTSDSQLDLMSQLGWATWYAPTRDDAFLSELGAMYGRKAYLVHATAATQFSVEGTVLYLPTKWSPGSYNLIGFSLDGNAPPTYAQFFEGSDAHRDSSIYRLIGGTWKKVADKANTAMRSGEAFWIYTKGHSDFQGPLEVKAGAAGKLVVREDKMENVSLINRTSYPISVTIEHRVDDGVKLPLSIVVDLIGGVWDGIESVESELGDASWSLDLPALGSGKGFKVPLALRAEKLDVAEASSLLCIKSDLGTEVWVPVSAKREDLQ